MFLLNYYKALSGHIADSSVSLVTYTGTARTASQLLSNIAMIGTTMDGGSYPSLSYLRTNMGANVGGVFLGTGTTPPTINDYCFSGDVITTFSYITDSVTKTEDSSGFTIVAKYTITNNGTSDFTVGEIGIMSSCTSSFAAANKILFERTVLDSPITVPVGGVGQITYTIRVDYPTA